MFDFGSVGILQIGNQRFGFRPLEMYNEYGAALILKGEFLPDVFEVSNLKAKAVDYLVKIKSDVHQIENVIFNDPATVVIWADGSKTVVKCQPGDVYSKETGLALCIVKKFLGNKGNFNEIFKKWIPDDAEAVEKISYNDKWRDLKDFIEEALDEGRDYGYDKTGSENYDKFCIFEKVYNRMIEIERSEKSDRW